jgi:hypothetical protein
MLTLATILKCAQMDISYGGDGTCRHSHIGPPPMRPFPRPPQDEAAEPAAPEEVEKE